jgi:hypothetical protein
LMVCTKSNHYQVFVEGHFYILSAEGGMIYKYNKQTFSCSKTQI